VADEDLVGAEGVSVGAVGWWLDDPSVGAGSDEVALRLISLLPSSSIVAIDPSQQHEQIWLTVR
jgi:hypothetical protein